MTHRIYIWFCAFALVSAACTKAGDIIYVPDPADAPSGAPLVTVIYDPGALGDLGYSDLIYGGVERAAVENGLRTLQLSPRTREEGLSYLASMFDQMCAETDTVKRLLIVAGAGYDAYVRANNRRLENHPRADLLYFETSTPLEGKGSSLHINTYGALYEAGAITPIFASEALVVAANSKESAISNSIEGFKAGFASSWVEYAQQERQCFVHYLSNRAGSGISVDDGDALTLMYTQPWKSDTRMIVPVCGGAGTTFRRLAENTDEFRIVGIDGRIISTASNYSAVRRNDKAALHCIEQWLSGNLPKHQTLGLADDYTGLEFHPTDPSFYDWFYALVSQEKLKAIHQEAIEKEAQYGK